MQVREQAGGPLARRPIAELTGNLQNREERREPALAAIVTERALQRIDRRVRLALTRPRDRGHQQRIVVVAPERQSATG